MTSSPDPGSPHRGQELPHLVTRPPGQHSRTFSIRHAHVAAPMGPAGREHGIVYAAAEGSNVRCVDGNRYLDLAGGFGAALVGHRHETVLRAVTLQAERLLHALGDVYPSDAKVSLCERLGRLFPGGDGNVALGQSGSDAVTIALKTAHLARGKPGVVAFEGSYHGLGYGPLAVSEFRPSYREPFRAALNPHVSFAPYPASEAELEPSLRAVADALSRGGIAAVLVEPILGRGGVIEPPASFLPELRRLTREADALLIVDEIWTGLGRAGAMLLSASAEPDIVCLGKGLGGGLPISAALGRRDVMSAWQRPAEVVHTSTFAGAPLACAAALATLDVIQREKLGERAVRIGDALKLGLTSALSSVPGACVRGRGLMLAVELDQPGAAGRAARLLLEAGYLVTTGGTRREALVLTPPLTLGEHLVEPVIAAVRAAVSRVLS